MSSSASAEIKNGALVKTHPTNLNEYCMRLSCPQEVTKLIRVCDNDTGEGMRYGV